MTTTLLFWIRLCIIAAILYTAGTYLFLFFKPGYREKFKTKKHSDYAGDIFFVTIAGFILFYLQNNFQKTFDTVLDKGQEKITDFRFRETRTGFEKSPGEYPAKLTIINYWATWCGPCRRELPDLNELYQAFPRNQLEILAISDEESEKVGAFLESKNYQFVTGTITRTNSILESIAQRPVSVLIDQDGQVLDMIVGSRGLGFFKSWVTGHLNKTSSAEKN